MRTRSRWIVLFIIVGLALFAPATLPSPASITAPETVGLDAWQFPSAQAQSKSLVWERFDVDIVVRANGTFDVTEKQTIRFTEGQFIAGFRNLDKRNFSRADEWVVTDGSGNTYRQVNSGEEPYTFVVQDRGSYYFIEWYFPRRGNFTETYSLSYRIHDGLRYYEGGDQVWWKAVYGDERPFPVLQSRVRVVVPPSASIQQWSAYINERNAPDAITASLVEGSQAILFDSQRPLQPGEEMEVRVEFTPGVVDGTVQPWQRQADIAAEERAREIAFQDRWGSVAMLGLCGIGLLLGFGGPAALYAAWNRYGRDKAVPMVADYLPEPPEELAPGLAGTLLDETVDMPDIVATIVDLARRQAISITEEKTEGFFRTGTDFIYRRERKDVPLKKYEIKLLDALFGSKDEVRLSDLKNKFYNKIDGIKKSMYEAVVEEGFFPRNPDSVRTQWGCAGVVLLFLGVGVAILGTVLFESLTSVGFVPGVGIAVTAIALIILARYMPRKTDKGAESAAKWQAFKTYLKDIDKYSDIEAQKEIWDRWLPYAIAFGVERDYMRKFEAIDAPAPGWYIPHPDLYGPYRRRYYGTPWMMGGAGGAGGGSSPAPTGGPGGSLGDMSRGMSTSLAGMSAGLSSMLSSAAATMTSRPASSSSGGGWSGGGGFSGGGSFGGGGGGGGGGGFR